MKKFIIASLLLFFIPTFLPICAAQGQQDEINFLPNLVYGRGGSADLMMDMASPKTGVGPFPVVVFLHGGGWREGNRQQLDDFAQGAAKFGYIGATVEYRLAPGSQFPAQIEDCKAAIRWIRANAKKYRADSNRIAVVGFSAGGHLACLLGLAGPNAGFEGTGGNPNQSSRIQAVVSFYGPTDFSTHDWSESLIRDVAVPFLGGTIREKPDAYRRASPITYVTKNAPPFLIFHGTADETVPVDQSRRLTAKLKAAGVPVKLVLYPGEGHGFSESVNQKSFMMMNNFLQACFKK